MILLIDFESTGVDTAKARITEIGAMLVGSTWNKIEEANHLVWESGYPAITPEVTKVTGIDQALLSREGVTLSAALAALDGMFQRAEYVIAFNSTYDSSLFKTEVDRNKQLLNLKGVQNIYSKDWLCAMSDLEKNYEFKSWRLMHVALEYGVTVNPKILHRAIADVELMRQMLDASTYSVQDIHAFRNTPWIYIEADVKKPWLDNAESSTLAKSLGYSWERARGDTTDRVFEKKWIKRIKETMLDKELNQPIKVRRI